MAVRRSRWTDRLTLAALTAAVAACSDVPPLSPTGPSTSALPRAGQRTGATIVIVDQASKPELMAALRLMGARIDRSLDGIGALSVRGLTTDQANAVRAMKGVQAIGDDYYESWIPSQSELLGDSPVTLDLAEGPVGEATQTSAAYFNTYQWNIKHIAGVQMWNATNDGLGALVCVLDSGVDATHVDLIGKVNIAASASFVATEPTIEDFNFHGTHVAGTITSRGLGVGAIANSAQVCAVKVLDKTGNGSFVDVANGIIHAANVNADVINMSLGAYMDPATPGNAAAILLLQSAIDYAWSQGTFIVAAAGNNGVNLATDPANRMSVPCELPRVFCVGATGPLDQTNFDAVPLYSAFGPPGVDLMAPGGNPDASANPPTGADVLDWILGPCSVKICGNTTGFVFSVGTSMAAPHVSAVAAVIQSNTAGIQSPQLIQQCLFEGADRLTHVRIDPLYSRGRLNAYTGALCTQGLR